MDYSEMAHDARRALEREREELLERAEQLDAHLQVLDAIDAVLKENSRLKDYNDDLQIEVMREYGERYPTMHILDWMRVVREYTPLVREAAKKPTAEVSEIQQREYSMAAEGKEDSNPYGVEQE